MLTLLAAVFFLAALAIPAWLLHRFPSVGWYWFVLSILAALALGLVPTPPALSPIVCQLLVGFVFGLLLFWGIGGLAMLFWHHQKHQEKHA